jgi:hypothetical protein
MGRAMSGAEDTEAPRPNGKADGEWMTAASIQRLTQVNTRTMARMADNGAIERRKNTEGVWLYRLSEVTALTSREENNGDHIDALTGLLAQAQTHLKETFKPVHDATQSVLSLLQEENDRLRKHCARLEGAYFDLVKAREEALSEAKSRDIAEKVALAREDRWKLAFNTFGQAAPMLLYQLIETVQDMKAPGARGARALMLRLQKQIDLEALSQDESLDKEEREFVQSVLSKKAALEDVAEESEKKGGDDGDG